MLRPTFFSLAAAIFLPALVGACAAPVDGGDGVATATQGLDTESVDDLSGSWFSATVTGWDGASGTLTGTVGTTTSAWTVTSATATRHAVLNQFYPQDPMLPVATQWNAILKTPGPNYFGPTAGSGDPQVVTFSAVTSQIASLGGKLRVSLNRDGTVKSLRPMP